MLTRGNSQKRGTLNLNKPEQPMKNKLSLVFGLFTGGL